MSLAVSGYALLCGCVGVVWAGLLCECVSGCASMFWLCRYVLDCVGLCFRLGFGCVGLYVGCGCPDVFLAVCEFG